MNRQIKYAYTYLETKILKKTLKKKRNITCLNFQNGEEEEGEDALKITQQHKD
jgi:hypothetical protein